MIKHVKGNVAKMTCKTKLPISFASVNIANLFNDTIKEYT